MWKYFLLFIFAGLLLASFADAVEPFGATVSSGTPSRSTPDAPQSAAAWAGNVTQLNINGYSATQTWQGYFGNVTGTITLRDSGNFTLYNWTLASPRGEIFASTNSSITWGNVQCLNFTSAGNASGNTLLNEQPGNYSVNGTNLTTLETRFNISSLDVDGVNETFNLLGAGTHDKFFVNNIQFSEGKCQSTRVFDASGPVSNKFEEVLLYEPLSSSVIFAAILEQDASGFNTGTEDFEMLVLENGHGSDTQATTYYFYVELE